MIFFNKSLAILKAILVWFNVCNSKYRQFFNKTHINYYFVVC
jgi:hypothetical protein